MSKIVRYLLNRPGFCRAVYRLGGPALAARLLSWSVDMGPWREDGPAVLCIHRNLFDKDIEQLRQRSKALNWPFVRAPHLGRLQAAWMPSEVQYQTKFSTHVGPPTAEAWEIGEKFAGFFLNLVCRRFGVAAIMSANIDYWQDEVMRRACRAEGIPFLVLSKEHQTIPEVYRRSVEYYRGHKYRFTGSAVAVFGPRTKDMLVESGVCEEAQVCITGAPRLDPWLDMDFDEITADTVTLLSFAGPGYGAAETFLEVLGLFVDAANRHRDKGLRFAVKCKNEIDRQVVHGLLDDAPISNLELTVAEPLFELLPRSRIVIGYNSLSLVEALFCPAVLMVPQWGEGAGDPVKQNIDPTDPDCRAAYRFAESAESLTSLIDQAVYGDLKGASRSLRRRLISRYFHIPSGHYSGECVESFALQRIRAGQRRERPQGTAR